MQRISGIRRSLAAQLGYLMPPVKVKDNINLRTRQYSVLLRGVEVAHYELPQGHELAIPGGSPDASLQGKPAVDPAFGLPAIWIRPDQVDRARAAGYTVVDAVSVMGTHITELVRKYSSELFTRQDAKAFCDRVAQDNPKVVEDLVPKLLPLVTIQRVLQNMLRERIPIRDGAAILEALGEAAQTTKNAVLLSEFVRQAIRRSIVKPHLNTQGELPAYFLDASVERPIEQAVEHSELSSVLTLSPEAIRDISMRLERKIDKHQTAVVITSFAARHFLRQIVEASLPNLTVLSHNEIPREVRVRSLGVID